MEGHVVLGRSELRVLQVVYPSRNNVRQVVLGSGLLLDRDRVLENRLGHGMELGILGRAVGGPSLLWLVDGKRALGLGWRCGRHGDVPAEIVLKVVQR